MAATALLLLALLGLTGCGSPSRTAPAPGAGTPPAGTLRFADLVNVDVRDIPLLMAFDELQSRGYRIEKTYLGSAALIADVLMRGNADVAMMNNQTAWTAVLKGAEIRTISQFTSPATLLAAQPGIASCHDLHGRKVGVPSTSGLSPLLFRLFFARNCPGTAPDLLVLPESAARAAAMLGGVVDAAMMPGEELLKIQAQAKTPFRVLMTNAAEFPDIQIDGLHVRRAWAEQNRGLVLDLLRAQVRAHRAIYDNPSLLYAQAMTRLRLDAATAKAIADTHLKMGIWDVNAGLTVTNVQGTLDVLLGADAIPAGTTASQVADLSYLDAVLIEMGRQPAIAPADRGRSSR